MDLVIDMDDPDQREFLLRTLNDLSGTQIFHIKRKTEKRSISQNKYYWAVVLSYVAEEIGMSAEDVHYCFRDEFVLWVKEHFGEEFALSTTVLNSKEMEEYLELIKNFASTFLHVEIPDPYSVVRK